MSYGFFIKRVNRGTKSCGKGMIKGTQVFTKDEGYTIHHAFSKIDGEVKEIVAIYKGDKQIYGQLENWILFGTTTDGSLPIVILGGSSSTVDVDTDVVKGWKAAKQDLPTTLVSMLYGQSKVDSVDVSHMDSSEVTSMQNMFYDCSGLTSLDLTPLDTSNVTSMVSMFNGCTGLEEVDLDSFNTAKVTNMDNMFSRCSSLTDLDLTDFDTSKVASMGFMFYMCSSLESVDLSSFDASKVGAMVSMFEGCPSLVSLDLSSFNTSSLSDMSTMFRNCSDLEYIDMSGWNATNVGSMSSAFKGCDSLGMIKVTGCNSATITKLLKQLNLDKAADSDTWHQDGDYLVPTGNVISGTTYQPDGVYTFGYNGSAHNVTVSGGKFTFVSAEQWYSTGWGMFAPQYTLNPTTLDMSGATFDPSGHSVTDAMLFFTQTGNNSTLKSLKMPHYANPSDSTVKLRITRYASAEYYMTALTDVTLPDDCTYNETFALINHLSASSISSILTTMSNNVCDQPGTDVRFHQNAIAIITEDDELLAKYHLAIDNGWKLPPLNVIKGTTSQADGTYYVCYNNATHAVTVSGGKFSIINNDEIRNFAGDSVSGSDRFFFNNVNVVSPNSPLSPVTIDVNVSSHYFEDDMMAWVRHRPIRGHQAGLTSAKFGPLGPNVSIAPVANGDYGNSLNVILHADNQAPVVAHRCTALSTSGVDNILSMCAAHTTTSTLVPDFHADTINNIILPNATRVGWYIKARENGWNYPKLGVIKGTTNNGVLPTVNVNNAAATVVVDPSATNGWRTEPIAENIEILGSCIYHQLNVNSLDLTEADLSHLVNGNSLAHDCSALTSVKATNLDLSSMEQCSWAFNSCTALTNLDLSGWNTPVWWNMNGFFNNCSSLVNLDLSGWDLSHITAHNQPFNQCHSLRSVKVEGCNDTTVNFLLTELNEVWAGGYATWMKIGNYLKPVGIKGTVNNGVAPTVKVNTTAQTVSISGNNWCCPVPASTTSLEDFLHLQDNVTSVDISSIDFSNVTNFSAAFSGLNALTALDTSVIKNTVCTNVASMFSGCHNVTSLDLSGLRTDHVTTVNSVFRRCYNLKTLDLSGWDISGASDTYGMFTDNESLQSVKVSGCNDATVNILLTQLNAAWAGGWATWMKVGDYLKPTGIRGTTIDGSTPSIRFNATSVTVNVNGKKWCASPGTATLTSLQYMCGGSSALTKIDSVDVSLLDVSHVTNFQGAFRYTQIANTPTGLEKWNTSSATSVMEMFSSSSFVSLDLHTFNTSNVTDPRWLVTQNHSLHDIDLSGWDLSKAGATTNMFNENYALRSVKIENCNSTTINKLINQLNTNNAGGYNTWHQSGRYLIP